MATRRSQRMTAGDAMLDRRAAAPRQRHNIGSTRSLLIMVASATLATMTMPVGRGESAEVRQQREPFMPVRQRQPQHQRIGARRAAAGGIERQRRRDDRE